MADDPIKAVIDALNAFQPGRDDIDNVPRLYDIFSDFSSLPHRERAMPAMFFLLERFPDAEFGSPGPLVHELAASMHDSNGFCTRRSARTEAIRPVGSV